MHREFIKLSATIVEQCPSSEQQERHALSQQWAGGAR